MPSEPAEFENFRRLGLKTTEDYLREFEPEKLNSLARLRELEPQYAEVREKVAKLKKSGPSLDLTALELLLQHLDAEVIGLINETTPGEAGTHHQHPFFLYQQTLA